MNLKISSAERFTFFPTLGTRIPKVQEILTNTYKKELGKNLNSDEAAAMGAVYKAADLSSVFKASFFFKFFLDVGTPIQSSC